MFSNIAFFKCVQILIRHLSAKINKYVKQASNSNRTFIFRSEMQIWRLFSDFSWISCPTKKSTETFYHCCEKCIIWNAFFIYFLQIKDYIQIISIATREEVHIYNHEIHQHIDTKWYFCFRRIFLTFRVFWTHSRRHFTCLKSSSFISLQNISHVYVPKYTPPWLLYYIHCFFFPIWRLNRLTLNPSKIDIH